MKHLYFLTQHVQDKPLSYDLREQVSDIIARLSKTNAVFGGDDPAEPLVAYTGINLAIELGVS